ncbi:MAG: outer membrane lipoprotein carrier protein LolA [Desulfobulbaceae bacterium]|nr:outer membrane lipoprotein carrier protein LolA [Desulfobulbaceae bacterium]
MRNLFNFFTLCGFSCLVLTAFLLPTVLTPKNCSAEPESLQQQLLSLQKAYRHLTSLQFNFAQLTRTGLRTRTGSGNAVFVRTADPDKPGIMRWNYTEPDPQIILNDGDKLSIYTENDHQLIVTSAAELNADITYAFFSGNRNLNDDFIPAAPDRRYGFALPDTPLEAIRLTPRKPHPQIKAVQLWFDQNFLIHRIIIEDHFDSITELTFTNIRTDTVNPKDQKQVDAILNLDLPPDTEIITQ